LDLRARPIHTNGKILDMPTHTTHWARLAAQENQNTITILTIPDKEWTTNDTPYKTKLDDTHVSIHFPLGTIIYNEPIISPELNKEPRKETLSIRILCIHHQNNEINIADLETKLLQITTNLNINPPYIKHHHLLH
jgi:hypothetical protein